ncbi:MAG: extracellular solute-binding protein [Acetobacteraceae bacterium]
MATITKRGLLATGAAALLAGPARALEPHEQALYDAAKKEGELTWYSGQISAEASEGIGSAFTKVYPGVKVNVVRSTSQVAFQRLSQDMRAGVAQCDIFSSTDTGHSLFLKREGKYLKYRPKNADFVLQAARDVDPDGYYHISSLGVYLMAHHTGRVPEADAPKSWKAALDPKWKDQLAIGHPGYSGAIGLLAVMLRKLYGWDYFKQLERNRPQIGRSSEDPVTLLNAAERTVGLGVPAGPVLLSRSRGNPLALIYPEEGSLLVASPSGIPSNAPHPNAAKLFQEFTASREFSIATGRYFNLPLRTDVPPPAGAKPLDQTKLIAPSPEEIESGVPEVKELWRDTFGV